MSLIVRIKKDFGAFRLNVDLAAENGVTSLLGASGCGKSMTLKCIAGIEQPVSGKIILNGVTGYTVKLGNLSALTARMKEFAEYPQNAEKMSRITRDDIVI